VRVLRCGLYGLIGMLLLAGGVRYWYYHRPLPRNLHKTLFDGVEYIREVGSKPRPMIVHIVTIQLDPPGLSFLVTPGEPGQELPLQARTTSQFLHAFGLQLAINGDFFYPWHSTSLWDYYPHGGDHVTVQGVASSRGVVYRDGSPIRVHPTLYLSPDN